MKMNRMVAKMLPAAALVGTVTPTYAQGVPRTSIEHSVSFGSLVSVLVGVVRAMGFDMFIYVPSPKPPPAATHKRMLLLSFSIAFSIQSAAVSMSYIRPSGSNQERKELNPQSFIAYGFKTTP